MPLASITNTLVQVATSVVGDLGLVGIFVLMLAESACIPIPSEATMLFAGFGVSQGKYSLVAITVAGVLGNLVGSWIAYAIGYFGRIELVERHAGKLHVKPQQLAWADRWFARYGTATVFFTRMLPIIRTFISLPAGVARMPFVRMTVFTLLGCIPWVFLLGFIGDQVGHNWTQWKDSLSYVDYAIVIVALGAIAYFTLRRRLGRRASRRLLAPAGGDEVHPQDSIVPGDETGISRAPGQARVAVVASGAPVYGEDDGHTTEVPSQRKARRDQRGGDAEPAQDARQRREGVGHEEQRSSQAEAQPPRGRGPETSP